MESLGMVAAWALFAVAAGFKLRRLGSLLRRQRLGLAPSTEHFRQVLERSWGRQT